MDKDEFVSQLKATPRARIQRIMGDGTTDLMAYAIRHIGHPVLLVSPKLMHQSWRSRLVGMGDNLQIVHPGHILTRPQDFYGDDVVVIDEMYPTTRVTECLWQFVEFRTVVWWITRKR